MASFTWTIALVSLAVSGCIAQSNYVDEGFEYELPAPRAPSRPAPRPVYSSSAAAPRPTPVPILKQINRHNEDGSYTYGYEGADGSFKIETKLTTGEVMGKYGYVDDVGKVRVVEYGANKYGFMPAGEGITVAPPTLVDETTRKGAKAPEYDDGQYYEEVQEELRPAPRPVPRPAPRPVARPAPQPVQYEQVFAPAARAQPAPRPIQQSFSAPAPRPIQQSFSAPASRFIEESFIAPAPRTPPRSQTSSFPSRPVIFANAAPVGPAPQRAIIANAAPAQVPIRTVSRPQPQAIYRPAPVYEEVPRPAPRPAPLRPQSGGGILDQLERDYALPQGGSAVADISFGLY